MDKQLSHRIDKVDQAFNKFFDTVFAVSTGTLALSITFKSSIQASSPTCSWLLSLSWVFLTITVILHIILRAVTVTFLASLETNFIETNLAIRNEAADQNKLNDMARQQVKSNTKLSNAADKAYKIMLSAFLLGILSFVVFAIINN